MFTGVHLKYYAATHSSNTTIEVEMLMCSQASHGLLIWPVILYLYWKIYTLYKLLRYFYFLFTEHRGWVLRLEYFVNILPGKYY